MTLLADPRAGLAGRLEALDQVLAAARGRLDPAVVGEAERVAGKAGERLRFGGAHTVVALAGTTGSGKSSLLNALAGTVLSPAGLRRPTTGEPHAAVWGDADAGPLLDWLQVPRRHLLETTLTAGEGAAGADGDLDGLVLLDLPDVDSVRHGHRVTAARLVERVDLLVWVLDPQKYADAAVHDDYLAPLAGHAAVTVVVLNQLDRLPDAGRQACLADLRRLLDTEGLAGVRIVGVSARTGEGLDTLRAELARRVRAKRTTVERLGADLTALATTLEPACEPPGGRERSGWSLRSGGPGRPGRPDTGRLAEPLVTALGDAAGMDVVADAVAATYRLRGHRATGWPLTRWVTRLRRDPARRLRLRDQPSELVRTSLPGPSAVQRARIDAALRDLSDGAGAGLPQPWQETVRRAATASRAELPDLLDRAVAGTDLELHRRPRWWRVAGLLQALLAVAAVAGLVWLTALFAVAWLQLPRPPTPSWERIPVPTLLLVGGLVLGFLLGVASRPLTAFGARRRARRARHRLEERVAAVARDAVVQPVEAELAAHAELCAAVRRLRG